MSAKSQDQLTNKNSSAHKKLKKLVIQNQKVHCLFPHKFSFSPLLTSFFNLSKRKDVKQQDPFYDYEHCVLISDEETQSCIDKEATATATKDAPS